MTIAKSFASKASIAFVAAAMIFSMFAPAARAQSAEDMQEMITDLLAQIAALNSQVGQGGQSVASGICPYTWTRDLSVGAKGADVMKLQQFLNANADTRVAASGAGSVGAETEFYGPATAAAVSKMQVMYRADILTPNGLVNPTGYFGASTRAKANSVCSTPVVVPGGDDEDEEEEEEEEGDVSLQGEATLDAFEVDDVSDDEVEEGETSEVGTFVVEFTDGDAEISRIDIALLAAGDTNTNSVQPWRAFETVSLWVDGDMIAEIDAADEDDYLDEDFGTLRFSGLDIVAMEDEELEISVGVTVQNGVDNDEAVEWELYALAVRYFDADGVATTETSVEDLDNDFDGATAAFTIIEEGENDGADVESSSDDPDASTLLVDEGTDDSEEFDIFMFEIETDEDSGTLELDDMIVDIEVTNAVGNIDTTVDEIIEEVTLTINGQSEDGEPTAGAGNGGIDHVITGSDPDRMNRVAYTFEFDGLELDADEVYTAVLSVVFKGQDQDATPDAYNNGVTVRAFVDGGEAQLEGSEGENVLEGTESSETHTLATVVPEITDVTSSTERNEATTAGTISFEFTVGADEDDVELAVANNADVNGVTDDVMFTLTGGAATTTATATLALVDGDATWAGGVWTVEEGDEATFALDIAFDGADGAGTYRATLTDVGGVEVDKTSNGMTLVAS